MGNGEDGMLLCPFLAVICYLSKIEQFYPHCSPLSSPQDDERRVTKKTLSFWLSAVTNETYRSPSEDDYSVVMAKAFKGPVVIFGGSSCRTV